MIKSITPESLRVAGWFLILLVISISPLKGQNVNLANQDAVIIEEENEIVLHGFKFTHFSITKKVRIRINTEKGIEKVSRFTLPETFDPSYIAHFPIARQHAHVYSRLECKYFKASIVSSLGVTREAEVSKKENLIEMVRLEDDNYGHYYQHIYEIQNLNVGDDLEVEYNIIYPYEENFLKLSSFRVFFHSDLYKEHYQLKFIYHNKRFIQWEFLNGGEPDEQYLQGEDSVLIWKKDHLTGCIHEPGGRPYTNLPHFVFSVVPPSMLYLPPRGIIEEYAPFYVFYARPREKRHLAIFLATYQGVNTQQYAQLERFVEKVTGGLEDDTLGYKGLLNLQNKIARDFTFQDDTAYFRRIDVRNPRMGDFTTAEILRDIARYDTYVALVRILDLNYFTTYVSDVRSGQTSEEYFASMFDSDYLLTVLLNNDFPQFIYPKKSRFGYFLNELPFYYEGAMARLIHIIDYNARLDPISEEYRNIQLPLSNVNDNSRRTYVMVEVDPEDGSVSFNARISLTGQFSTMTRGIYQYDEVDESINPLYGRKVWELDQPLEVTSLDVKVKGEEFPFPTDINTRYSVEDLITISNDTISCSIENWFNHIIYDNFNIENRQMDFYPDFHFTDSYVYFIKFDKQIEILDDIEATEIDTEFAELKIHVDQMGTDAVKIETLFALKDTVPVDNIRIIKEVFDQIETLNNSILRVIVTNDK